MTDWRMGRITPISISTWVYFWESLKDVLEKIAIVSYSYINIGR